MIGPVLLLVRRMAGNLVLCAALLFSAAAVAQSAQLTPYQQWYARQSRFMAPVGPRREPVVIPGARVVSRDDVLGIVSGGLAGTYVRIANDLATLFDAPDSQLRILPIVTRGSLQNISDLINVTDVDVAITQSDVLTFLRQNGIMAVSNQSIGYLAKLYDEEVHILAAPGIDSLAGLAGRKVNMDTRGSGTSLTSGIIFNTLGIKVQPTNDDQETALGKLRRGEIAALVYVAGKPARLFSDIPQSSGLHLLPIPLNASLLETYSPSGFGHVDYPGLVPEGGNVDTIAVGAVMAVFNWPAVSPRYGRLARFTNAFFNQLATLQAPGHHPKWKDVNLAAQVPGWTRFPAAAQWLRAHGTPVAAQTQPATPIQPVAAVAR